MIQIEHLLAVTEVITNQVTAEAALHPKKVPLSSEELAASHAERAKVMLLLDTAIAKTEGLRTQFANTDDTSTNSWSSSDFSWMEKQKLASEVAEVSAVNGPTVPTDPKAMSVAIVDGLTAKDPKGLGDQTMSLKAMAKAAEPILATFESILLKKGLENYNASLNTAPVVGFKGENVVYIQTKSNRLPTGSVTNDSWAVFDKVPVGFDASQGATHFFPYEGNLYIANGTKLWVRKCRPKGDPVLEKQACNNWPKMYYDTWEHLGDNALPSGNFTSIDAAVKFQLVALTSEGELQVLQQESLGSSNTFSAMSYVASGKNASSTPPSWLRIALNNGKFIGYDRGSNLWDIVPDFTSNTYTTENKYTLDHEDVFTEYTANDIGLVVAKKDGFLYKRIAATVDASAAPKDNEAAPAEKTKWIKWIAQEGVKNLGVASPGIILDLLTLTNSLKTRYLETQATLWPVVNTIKTFAGTHRVFLQQVNQAAKDFSVADSDAEKEKLALKVGKKAIGHAKAWSTILTKTVINAQEPVAAMAKQLSGVYTDLQQQIGLLNVKLVELKNILAEQGKALSAAKVGFWAGIGTMLLGKFSHVSERIGNFTNRNVLLVVGAGVMFVGGLIAASVSASKASKAAEAIAKTNSDISLVETAIRELTAVTDQFGEINNMYGVLNMFWGRMLGHATSIGTNDAALLKIIGMGLLTEEDASFVHAMEMTEQLEIGAQAYQDLISRQGIKIPTSNDDEDDEDDEDDNAAVASLGPSGHTSSDFQYARPLPVMKFALKAAHAQYALEQGNDDDYEALMMQALETQEASLSVLTDASMNAGLWFDVGTLKATAGVFLIESLQANLNTLRLSTPEAVVTGLRAIGSLVNARKNVAGSLRATIELAKLMGSWSNDPFDEESERHEKQVKTYKKPALDFCHLARDVATIANNSFAEINHLVQDHAIEVRRKIDGLRNEQKSLSEAMDGELRRIDVPFPLQLFGSQQTVMAWVQARAREIGARYEPKNQDIQTAIDQHEASLLGWATFHHEALPWVDMCMTISRNLASIQSLLESMGMELKVDALLYKQLMVHQWHQLIDNAQAILSLVGLSDSSGQQDLQNVVGFGAGMIARDNEAELMSVKAETSPKELLKTTVSPEPHLAKYLMACTGTSQAFYTTLTDLSILPLAGNINSGISSKAPKSILEVVQDLRSQYSNLAAANFTVVSQLMTTAEVQQVSLKRKAVASLRNDILVQRLLIYTESTRRSALNASEQWATASDEFARTCSTIKDNVAIYRALMKDLENAAAKKQKELDEYIAGIAADAIACCMISIGIGFGIAFGGAAGLVSVAKKAWMVIGKVGTVYDHQGLGWKDAFKTWYKDLDISEQAAVIANLKSFSKNLEQAADKLANASELLKDAVMALQDQALAISRMHAHLVNASEKMQVLKPIELDDSDREEITYQWRQVADAAEAWMNEFSRQGISPILQQFEEDIEE
ncbi:alpha-amylase type a isozyme [Stemphylium lycopersici]|uniref:Alpha-amylase type a isozyme n=1 Tax=Stemphylium lycopersici TaxID=183478 RepID=A0A364MST1_STELY|nr:alpha-amylase type a isozyme [Stemphylium lycopersici]